MGWESIEYACGHTGRKQIYGKVSERDRLAKWYGRNKCEACTAADRDALAVKCAEAARSRGCPS